MTFSIVARSSDGQAHGVAVASKFLGVGAAVPAAEAEVGAIATQSYANLAYRPQGLALLRTGVPAAGVVAGLTAADDQRATRQLGVVGAVGDGATFTGADCHAWAGGAAGDGYAIQGNILTGPEVVAAMERAWLDSVDEDRFARRLLAALRAGDEAGGDRRGRQSAAMLVVARGMGYGGTSDVVMDLRVDDHTDPMGELARLLDLHTLYFDKADPARPSGPHRRDGRRGAGAAGRARPHRRTHPGRPRRGAREPGPALRTWRNAWSPDASIPWC